jgi:hypothetical protein
MPDSSKGLPVSRRIFSAALVLLGSTLLPVTTLAQSPVDPATIDVGHPTGHVHDHGNQTWPPQPPGIQNVVPLSDPGKEARVAQARQQRANAQERVAIARADVQQALGERFTRAAAVDDRDKSGAIRASRLVYFSYSNNSTVEVTLDGQRVRGVRTMPAAEYQPEITDGEIAEAEGIARAHFMALGEDRVAQLQAFGILAYQPTGKGFYATRVLYISFHEDSDSPPEYVAWVDLSRQQVLRAGKEGQ